MADPDLERILAELLKKREELATLTWNERKPQPEPATASTTTEETRPEPEKRVTAS